MSATAKVMKNKKTTLTNAQQFFIPHQIKSDAIKKNHKLLTDEQIHDVTVMLHDAEFARHSKENFKHLDIPYGIIKGEHGLYAIYNETTQVELGRGGFGAVKIAQNLETGEWCVIKTEILANSKVSAEKKGVFKKKHDLLYKELEMLIFLGKSNEGLFIRTSRKKPHITKADIILKYAKGENLYKHIIETQVKASLFFDMKRLDIIIAIVNQYIVDIFSKGLLHRDLKLENIIYDFNTDKIEIVDYGFARFYDKNTKRFQDVSAVGTEMYQSSEVVNKFLYSEKSEIYALGVLFREILLNQAAETTEGTNETIFIPYGQPTLFENNREIKDFIGRMLNKKAELRPDLSEVQSFLLKFRCELIKRVSDEKSSTANLLTKLPLSTVKIVVPSFMEQTKKTPVIDTKPVVSDKYSSFKLELNAYILQTQKLLTSKLFKLDSARNIQAAKKMYNLLNGINVKFTREDITVLRSAKGLSAIIKKYEKKHLLPLEFTSSESNKRPVFRH